MKSKTLYKYISTTFIVFLFLLSYATSAQKQTYDTPQWSINLYFEDATGATDMLTIGYDPTASIYSGDIDPQFNEGWMQIDTTQFNVYTRRDAGSNGTPIYPPIDTDIVRKVNITSWPRPYTEFGWVHGQLPVTMTWDEPKLDSSDLPPWFPDLETYPRARIDMWFNTYDLGPACLITVADPQPPTVILTRDTSYNWPLQICSFSDSLTFEGSGEIGFLMNVPLVIIAPYTEIYWTDIGIDDLENNELICYPNPAQDYIAIRNEKISNSNYQIYDVFGRVCKQGILDKTENKIDISQLTGGVYFIKTNEINLKFIKL